MSTLKLIFLDREKVNHRLYFHIYDSNLANRWVKITKLNQEHSKQLNARFTNTTYKDIDLVREKLNKCLGRINKVYDQPLPIYQGLSELDTKELNYLHEEFERYGDRMEELIAGNTNWTRDMHEDFLQLNELIHLHEDVLKSKTSTWPNMALLYDYYPQEFHYPIHESDKIWVTPQLRWGEVYLGYNTLGKDWLKVHVDNDVEVVERDQVRPQQRFAAETWINFGPDSNPYWSLLQFEKWVNKMPDELKRKVPMNNLNKLTLGRFKIGHLVVDEEFVAKYGGTIEDYQGDSAQIKLDWNMNFFSKFEKLISVEFV